MEQEKLREVAESLNRNDQIKIGRFEVPLLVVTHVGEGSDGHVHFEADRPNFPEEGICTSIYATVGAEDEDLMVTETEMLTEYEIPENRDHMSTFDVDFGEILSETTHELEEMFKV